MGLLGRIDTPVGYRRGDDTGEKLLVIDALTVLVYQEVKLPGRQGKELVCREPQVKAVGPALIPQLLIR